MRLHVVAEIAEIPPGKRKLVEVGGRAIVVFNHAGNFYALLNRCPHQGGSLCEGKLSGLVTSQLPGDYEYASDKPVIRCPWHQWEFDIRTGKSWCEPDRIRVRTYKTEVKPGSQLVEGPYRAETFAVKTDGAYVLIEM